jgi:hypothetical protein
MEKAKAAVSGILSKAGHHDTTVHETVAPAVTNETVSPTRHENVTTAVDREVHQDHYHTSVQPVHHREVLPEQHHHQQAAVEERQFNHGNKEHVAQKLQQEAAQFKHQSTRAEETRTTAAAPTVAGEHVHHHVHENIQPVVHKQTIEPHVVHTTVPVHEVHHNAAQHHTTSALPAVSMADFKKQGGSLTGREERYDGFEGEPRSIGNPLGSDHHQHGHQHGTNASSGLGHNTSTAGTRDSGISGVGSEHKKASLMDKINPKIDSDGDGKAGFMK